MKKILLFGITENPGGVESFLMNYLRKIDKSSFSFDVLCNTKNKIAYEDELIRNNWNVYHITSRSKNPLLFKKEMDEFFSSNSYKYDAIWVNVSSLANIDYLKWAKKYNIPKRIIHSHNSENMDSFLRGLLHKFNKNTIDKYATDFWACSKKAAEWFYEDTIIDRVKYIKNAIDVDSYCFDDDKRKKLIKDLNLNGKYIIGNVGRLHFQKNQSFIIDLFSHYFISDKNAILILVGDGEDKDELIRKCQELHIDDKIIFTGIQKDIQAYLSLFDLFLFPSLFEGQSISLLEAQANGLPILTSKEAIVNSDCINENIRNLSLNAEIKEWVETITQMKNTKRLQYDEVLDNFVKNEYLLIQNIKVLEEELSK